jgi:7,8-dihydropterin-6-yl-methyl-4-(beta-D-ribofuranosyl)aminobenzene 5'-phosphate synthase
MKPAALLLAIGTAAAGMAQQKPPHKVKQLEVYLLSTMLTDNQGIGEWGFAAIVEADGRRILFDTGARPDTVLKNLREMKLDLSGIADVILSHNHGDHTGGLMTLRREFPQSLRRAHAGEGIFLSRPRGAGGGEGNPMVAMKAAFEGSGGSFVVHDAFDEIYPGVWLTGSVPRKYPERNWSGAGKLRQASGVEAEDNLPEDMSMVVVTDKGLVLISGCGHAGIINTIEHTRAKLGATPLHAALGGFHLFPASDRDLDWTAGKLKEFGLQNFIGAHCTGIEATYRIRERAGLSRKTCVVGSVGTRFSLRDGVVAGAIAR